MKIRKLWKTKLGIPIWLIIGLSVFLISSATYEIYQEVAPWNQMTSNLIMIGMAGTVLIFALLLNFTSLKTIKKIIIGQMGGKK